jgi:hypothetical protein
VQRFHESGEKGPWFLYDAFGINPQLLAVIIAAAAVAAFIGAEKVESLVNHRTVMRRPIWRLAVPAFGALAAIALVALVIPHSTTAAPAPVRGIIAAEELAKAVVAEPWRYRIDGQTVADAATDRTLAIAGEYKPPVASVSAAAAPPKTRAPVSIAKPKKKGGGCSS